MDGDDFTLMTTESMAIVLNDNGCCVRHPLVKLKEYDENGDVYLKESCPECQSEFSNTQSLLLEKRRDLDRKLEELGDDSPHDERHADFVHMVAPSVGNGWQPQSSARCLSPTLPAVRPVPHDLDALAAQMQHIQHMQDILTLQKDRELYELREKVDALHADLTEKKIEIALLKERMTQQQLTYDRELKLIQRAVALDKERRDIVSSQDTTNTSAAKEIHIRSLNVQVGHDYTESQVTQKVAAATLTETLERQGNKVFIEGTTSTREQSTQGPKNNTSPVESNMATMTTSPVESTMTSPGESSAPTRTDDSLKQAGGTPSVVSAETSNDSSNVAAVAVAVGLPVDYEERPPPVSRFESKGELPAVLGQLIQDESVVEESIKEEEDEESVEETDEEESIEEEEGIEAVWEKKPSYLSYGSTTVGNSTYLSSTADENPHAEYPYHRDMEKADSRFVPRVQERAVEQETSPFIEEDNDYVQVDEDEESEEEDDAFDASGHGPAPPVTFHPLIRKLTPAPYNPGPLTTPHGQPIFANDHRKEPMRASMQSLSPPKHGGITGVLDFHGMGSGATPVEDFEINADALPTVPLDEQVTLASSFDPADRFNPRVTEDYPEEKTVNTTGPTVASSTYGENRHLVTNQILLDPYGDKGSYSGVLLLSTNMPHGNGKMLYEDDGRTYDGDWRHGRWHGWGQATFSNGDCFEGFYKYDQRHGQGKYQWRDGRIYEGEFNDDKREGKGHFIWPDGADYVGDFKNGQRDGYGVYKFSHGGGQYAGDWVNGRYEGQGECNWKDGRRYKVSWISVHFRCGNVLEQVPT
jgi:hypothetical protein